MYFLFPLQLTCLCLFSLWVLPQNPQNQGYLEGLLSLKKTTQSAYSLWSVGNSIQPVFTFRGDEHFTQRNDSLMVKFLVLSRELMGLSSALQVLQYWWPLMMRAQKHDPHASFPDKRLIAFFTVISFVFMQWFCFSFFSETLGRSS